MAERKGQLEAVTMLNLKVPEPELSFQDIHRAGARRHPDQWVSANQAAITVLWGTRVQPDDPEMRRVVSLMVLRVLDASRRAGREPAPLISQRYDGVDGAQDDQGDG